MHTHTRAHPLTHTHTHIYYVCGRVLQYVYQAKGDELIQKQHCCPHGDNSFATQSGDGFQCRKMAILKDVMIIF